MRYRYECDASDEAWIRKSAHTEAAFAALPVDRLLGLAEDVIDRLERIALDLALPTNDSFLFVKRAAAAAVGRSDTELRSLGAWPPIDAIRRYWLSKRALNQGKPLLRELHAQPGVFNKVS